MKRNRPQSGANQTLEAVGTIAGLAAELVKLYNVNSGASSTSRDEEVRAMVQEELKEMERRGQAEKISKLTNMVEQKHAAELDEANQEKEKYKREAELLKMQIQMQMLMKENKSDDKSDEHSDKAAALLKMLAELQLGNQQNHAGGSGARPKSQGHRGNQGYQGHRGNQGYQGHRGNQGYQGHRGNQGYQGHRGNQGYQGHYDHQGNRGNYSKQDNSEDTLPWMDNPKNQDNPQEGQKYKKNFQAKTFGDGGGKFSQNNQPVPGDGQNFKKNFQSNTFGDGGKFRKDFQNNLTEENPEKKFFEKNFQQNSDETNQNQKPHFNKNEAQRGHPSARGRGRDDRGRGGRGRSSSVGRDKHKQQQQQHGAQNFSQTTTSYEVKVTTVHNAGETAFTSDFPVDAAQRENFQGRGRGRGRGGGRGQGQPRGNFHQQSTGQEWDNKQDNMQNPTVQKNRKKNRQAQAGEHQPRNKEKNNQGDAEDNCCVM